MSTIMTMRVPSRQPGRLMFPVEVCLPLRLVHASCGLEAALQRSLSPSLLNGPERVLSKVCMFMGIGNRKLTPIQGIIEKSVGDGQKTYYSELEAAMPP